MNDAISRLGVSAWLANMGRTKLAEYILDEDRFPSVITPTEKIGHWIYDGDCIHCSSCKSTFDGLFGSNFCPHCGARMVNSNE